MKNQIISIYAIRNIINEKIYVGSTHDFSVRKMKHLTDLRANRHHSPILQNAFNKYGETSFNFEIIEIILDIKDLLWKEQHYLDTLKPQYNICKKVEQSRQGLKSSPEHCARMSASLKGRPGTMKGKKFCVEHKIKISLANKGNKNCLGHNHSSETKELLRLHHNKKSNPLKSNETKKRLSEAHKKRWSSYTEDKRKEIGHKVSLAQSIMKETVCIICNKKIKYHSQGKYIPKTCSPKCLSEHRKEILSIRNKKGLASKASKTRWANITPKQRVEFSKKLRDRRKPLKKTLCLICSKEIIYRTQGKQIPKTCGPECLSEYRRRLLLPRLNEPAIKFAAKNRWTNTKD